jgi:hypothetical protein
MIIIISVRHEYFSFQDEHVLNCTCNHYPNGRSGRKAIIHKDHGAPAHIRRWPIIAVGVRGAQVHEVHGQQPCRSPQRESAIHP